MPFFIAVPLLIVYYVVNLRTSSTSFVYSVEPDTPEDTSVRRRFAVFGCATPDRESHRSYDYAFYLPLTVLAWHRIGFESIVLLIGDRQEWLNRPPLAWIVESLEQLNATTLFINADQDHRGMLSQTARIFVSNMDGYPGQDDDYIVTTDADLWPLRRQHFVPRINHSLVLVHSDCCGWFNLQGEAFRMLPMSNIGASASVWREILNTDHIIGKDSASILNYFADIFGDSLARKRATYASDAWSLDQMLITMKIDRWRKKQGPSDSTFKVSDKGFQRIDRASWHPRRIPPSSLDNYYDAHLIEKAYTVESWNRIRPLLHLMFNATSWQLRWSYVYAETFHFKMTLVDNQ